MAVFERIFHHVGRPKIALFERPPPFTLRDTNVYYIAVCTFGVRRSRLLEGLRFTLRPQVIEIQSFYASVWLLPSLSQYTIEFSCTAQIVSKQME